jgi:hypothetical protein
MESKSEYVVSGQDQLERPWVRCRHCLKELCQVDVYDGWTRIKIGNALSEGDIRIVCPSCGTVRAFYSRRAG